MNELRRLYGKKTVFLFIAIIILNMGIFMLSANPEKEITLTSYDLDDYLDNYYDFLENTNENSDIMSGINMYKDGFAADNIRKTTEAYRSLEGIKLVKADNRGIVHFIKYSLSDMVYMAFMIIISIGLINERKKGLVNFVRSTYRGRTVLYFNRIFILAFSAVMSVLLLYGGNYLGMLISTGNCDIGRSIQSLPEFMHCPYNITIGGYIFRMLVTKAAVGFTAALAFFIILSVSGTAVTYITAGLVTAAELLMYRMIGTISKFSIFKYVNIFAGFKVMDYYTGCNFLNISGKAVSTFDCMICITAILIIILIISGLFIHGKMYVTGTGNLQSVHDKILWVLEKVSLGKTLTGWELYKLLIKQGGVLFMTAAFVLTVSASVKYNYFNKINVNEIEWYNKYQGQITQESIQNANNDYDTIEQQVFYWKKEVQELNNRDQVNPIVLRSAQETLDDIISRREGLKPIIDNMNDAWEYNEKTGNKVTLIRPHVYDLLLVRDISTSRLASLYILIGIICSVSGVYAYDTQNNMRNTIRSSFRGRKKLTFSKIISVFIICTVLCTAIHLIQFIMISKISHFTNMDVPVQSLQFMRDFPLYISIKEYLVLLFVVRALAACASGVICMIVSRLCPDTSSAMGVSVFILAVPSIFAQLVPDINLINAVSLISGEFFR